MRAPPLHTTQGGHDVVEEFREACGPSDPEVAKALYPDSLRALLGVQQVNVCVFVCAFVSVCACVRNLYALAHSSLLSAP